MAPIKAVEENDCMCGLFIINLNFDLYIYYEMGGCWMLFCSSFWTVCNNIFMANSDGIWSKFVILKYCTIIVQWHDCKHNYFYDDYFYDKWLFLLKNPWFNKNG